MCVRNNTSSSVICAQSTCERAHKQTYTHTNTRKKRGKKVSSYGGRVKKIPKIVSADTWMLPYFIVSSKEVIEVLKILIWSQITVTLEA